MSTRFTRFTWARPVQTNAQCYEFSILCVHLTQIHEMKVLILLDKEWKKLNKEIQNGESLFWFHSLKANQRIKKKKKLWKWKKTNKVFIIWSVLHRVQVEQKSVITSCTPSFYRWKKKWSRSVVSLCDPIDCNLLGSSVYGILQARILEWVAISF